MTTVVVDTSVAVKWVLAESDSATANALLAEWTRNGVSVLAPALFSYEVTNVVRQQIQKGVLTLDEAKLALSGLFAVGPKLVAPVDQHAATALGMRSLELAHQFGQPAAYDAHYLALAEREGCEYWTADERPWNSVKAALPWVRWLGGYSPGPSGSTTP